MQIYSYKYIYHVTVQISINMLQDTYKDIQLSIEDQRTSHQLSGGDLTVSNHQKWLASCGGDGRLIVRTLDDWVSFGACRCVLVPGCRLVFRSVLVLACVLVPGYLLVHGCVLMPGCSLLSG